MAKPEFVKTDKGMWQWGEWLIVFAYERFWLLTPTPREFGPFRHFDEALAKVEELTWR